jgi:predicted acylesterase/phospholipase RssA
VLQGGGALGAYQAGVYQALHEAEIEPDWVIGTSIGAINAGLIAGSAPGQRVAKLQEFWLRITQSSAKFPCCGCKRAPIHCRLCPQRSHHCRRRSWLFRAESRRLDRYEGKAWR